MKNIKEFTGFAIALTNHGPRLYVYNQNLISIEEFLKIEDIANDICIKRKYRLFKVYDTEYIGFIAPALN